MFPGFPKLRLAAGLAAAVAVTATAALILPAAGHATEGTSRQRADSDHNSEPSKAATATCPDGQAVLGGGGRIADGDGTVVLAAVIPDLATASVTARGEAIAGWSAPWSVTAVAVCGRPPSFHALVRSEPGSRTAICPGGTLPVGTGFELPGPAGDLLLTGLVPDLAGASVTVRAVRRDPRADPPAAYAICLATYAELRTSPPGAFDDSSPKTATVVSGNRRITGVGGIVGGAVTDVFIDALLPASDLRSAVVAAVRIPSAMKRSLADADPGEDWSLSGAAIETHDYY